MKFLYRILPRRLWPAAQRCSYETGSSPEREFAEARRLCNPLEPLGEGRNGGMNRMFMNRSAIKLANIDAILDFSLTTYSTTFPGKSFTVGLNQEHMQKSPADKTFLFVDLCGSPGGFSEYIMKRYQKTSASNPDDNTSREVHGFGFSLIGRNEHGNGTTWRLPSTINKVSNGCQVNYQICRGIDGSGDIYKWENVIDLQRTIFTDLQKSIGLTRQQQAKVHLVVADGGFDAQRDSEYQEELSQKLVVCQVAAGLLLLLPSGTLVVKMFGFQTGVVRGVMQSLNELFDEIMVLKPISSRPASSERYVVCRGFHGVPDDWDGLLWRDSMLLGYPKLSLPSTDIGYFLDEFDRDLLSLNLKACFAILSCLEGKEAALSNGSLLSIGGNPMHVPVDIEMYMRSWKLN